MRGCRGRGGRIHIAVVRALRFNLFRATSAAAGAGPGNNRQARWARVYEDWESSGEAESRTRQVLRVFNAAEP